MKLIRPSWQILALPSSLDLIRLETAGRTCTGKQEKVDGVESSKEFIKSLIKRGHESVIEHALISVKIVCDRGIMCELTRHRLASFSVSSTRYIRQEQGVTFVIPPWIDGEGVYWEKCMLEAESNYHELLKRGWTPEQARCVLPNSAACTLIMSANPREWRHIFKLRCSSRAHPQMREIMIPLRDELIKLLPCLFGDLQ
jgi:thymidylate synthase (FAD)